MQRIAHSETETPPGLRSRGSEGITVGRFNELADDLADGSKTWGQAAAEAPAAVNRGLLRLAIERGYTTDQLPPGVLAELNADADPCKKTLVGILGPGGDYARGLYL